jgi:transposase
MASVNRVSLRAEFEGLKGQFEALCASGRLSAEGRALVQALLMLFEVLMAVFMEKSTPKNSRNASVPPSQTPKDDETASQPGTQSKGKDYDAVHARHTRTIETVAIASVTTCPSCGADLSETPCQGHERRTRIDLLFEKVVSHVDAEVKSCPRCQALTKGTFPADLSGPLQYGAGIKAFVLHLLVSQMVALKRVSQTLATLIEQIVSEATLLKWVLQLHQALAEWERTAIEELLAQPTLHVDETSLRVERKNHWIHVCSGADITVKFLHPKRGLEAITAINIIPRYGGTIIHDCWASYLSYAHCGHGLCGAHLLRELTFVIESNGYPWARHLKRLLKETRAKVAERDNKQLTETEYKKLRKRYRTILTRGAKQLPPLPPRKQGSRGRVAKSDAHNLWERFKHYEDAVLLFAKLPHVPFTNNRAERDLRMSKVKQKISGCFRTREYAEAYCRISSYLQTMANRGYNPLVAIQMALSGQLYAQGRE